MPHETTASGSEASTGGGEEAEFAADNPLHAFARWTATTPRTWSATAQERALNAFIDLIAVMVPGGADEVSERVGSQAQRFGAGTVATPGRPERLSAPMAALLGGTVAHALDFDDNFDPAKAHATAVLGPALLAAGDDRDLDGSALLDAYIVGLQMIGRVGQGVNPFHRSRGWHATGTVACVGSAAGVARLIGLGPSQTAHAISMATSMAGGFMSQFGTMTKPLHAGLAAEGAVKAAYLAQAGVTAGDQALHTKTGMGTLMVGPDVEELRAAMAGKAEHGQTVTFATRDIGTPLHIEEYGLKVKRFPNCGSVHRALDGLLALRVEHSLSAEDVQSIHVRAPAAHLRNLMYERPVNPMQAKFSLEYNLAYGLLHGEVGLSAFEPDVIGEPAVMALLPLVTKEYVEALESEFDTEVHITLKNGTKLATSIHMPVGSAALPLSREQLWEKFRLCCAPRLDKEGVHTLQVAIAALERGGKIRSLTNAARIGNH